MTIQSRLDMASLANSADCAKSLKQNWVLEKVSLFSSPVCCEPFRSEVPIAIDSWGLFDWKSMRWQRLQSFSKDSLRSGIEFCRFTGGIWAKDFVAFFQESAKVSTTPCEGAVQISDRKTHQLNSIHSTCWDASGWSKTPYGNREFRAGNCSQQKTVGRKPCIFLGLGWFGGRYSFARKDGLNENCERPFQIPLENFKGNSYQIFGNLN